MVSNEQIKEKLIVVYSSYIKNNEDKENKSKAYEIYLKYFNGANALFNKNVSIAIWKSFDLSEGKLSKEEAKKILAELKKI